MDNQTLDFIFNAIGFLGSAILLTAYFLLERGKLASNEPPYLWLNLISALCLGASLLRFWNMSVFMLEGAWFAISLLGLIKLWRKKI